MSGIAVVVVTRNRRDLLQANLAALYAQTRSFDALYLINNASTDDTLAMLAEAGWTSRPGFNLITLEINSGGAGGFNTGMATAYAHGYEWLWIMDDDCIPAPTALAALIDAYHAFPAAIAPWLLASRVDWSDNQLHPLNFVSVKNFNKEFLYTAPLYGCMSMRSATFVSLLVHRRAVSSHGLPNTIYFLWHDDVEWTARVLKEANGVLVPASVVEHRTDKKVATLEAPPARFYFHVRNALWTLLASNCYNRRERIFGFVLYALSILMWLGRRWWIPKAWWTVITGLVRGAFPPLSKLDAKCRFKYVAGAAPEGGQDH